MPLQHTIVDLWRMVREHKCVTIVMLHPRDEADTVCHYLHTHRSHKYLTVLKGKGSPYSITECRVPKLIPVHSSHFAGDMSHKSGGRLPLLSIRPAVTLATLKRAATIFCCLVNRGTFGMNSLPKTVIRQRRDCDLNSDPFAPESSTLTTRLPSHQASYKSQKTE